MNRFSISIYVLFLAGFAFRSTNAESFPSNDTTIHYQCAGKETGPPIILLHGWLSCASEILEIDFAKKLANQGYWLIAPDQRGHGQSDKPHDADKYGLRLVHDVVGLMDHLTLADAHIVGYSMGAMIAAKLLTEHPERCRSVTLGGTGGMRPGDLAAFVEAFANSVTAGKSTFRALNETVHLTQLPQPDNKSAGVNAIRARLNQNDPHAMAAVALSWRTLAVSDHDLQQINKPTLVIFGEREAPFNLKSVRRFNRLVVNSRLVAIPKEYHDTAIHTLTFADEVRRFIEHIEETPAHDDTSQ